MEAAREERDVTKAEAVILPRKQNKTQRIVIKLINIETLLVLIESQ